MKLPPREKPILIFDGDCGFCRGWILRWRLLTGDRVEYVPFQQVAGEFPQIPSERFAASVQLIEPTGDLYDGAEAIFRTLAYAPGRSWMLWVYRKIPGFAWVSEWFYRLVAQNRYLFSSLTRIFLPRLGPATYQMSSQLFLRFLGLIYLIAFGSLWTQIHGLVGQNGIQPVEQFLKAVQGQVGMERYWFLPTLCWWNPSDYFLDFLCAGGVILSLPLVVFGLTSAPALLILWGFYLSLTVVCTEFLAFQWDNLLLEAGFLSIFLVPFSLKARATPERTPSSLALWLLRWLLFRLIFSSGVVKLMSGDPTWRSLTALTVHYETQPLPNWISWYAHQLPVWFHQASTAGMFAVELGAPFLIFTRGRLRLFGAAAMIGLQVVIMATGNYCFFNWLTIALCLLLIEDADWPGSWRRNKKEEPKPIQRNGWPVWIIAPVTASILVATSFQMGSLFGRFEWPGPIVKWVQLVAPFRSINGYGLFAIMTTSRPEIIVEGSQDGTTWLAYEFKYKPGDLQRPPRFVAPHQPRLDWQMWFAALGKLEQNTWLLNFCVRLLQGSPPVLALLKENPFPGQPPRYIRAALYVYHFTDLKTRRETGAFWRREFKEWYSPVLSLRNS